MAYMCNHYKLPQVGNFKPQIKSLLRVGLIFLLLGRIGSTFNYTLTPSSHMDQQNHLGFLSRDLSQGPQV